MSQMSDIDELALKLHEKIVAGDGLATSMLAELVIPPIIQRLRRKYHTVPDQHLIDTAVADAMLTYLKAPDKFDDRRGGLLGYLRMSAEGDLLNALRQLKIRGDRQQEENVVEFMPRATEYRSEEESGNPESIYARVEEQHRVDKEVWSVLEESNDREIARLMIEGVRETEEFAGILGILDKSSEEQAQIVKRHKDRIKLALRRKLKARNLSI